MGTTDSKTETSTNIDFSKEFISKKTNTNIGMLCMTIVFTVLGALLTIAGLFPANSPGLTILGFLIFIVFLILDIAFIQELYKLHKYKNSLSDSNTILELDKMMETDKRVQEAIEKTKEAQAAQKQRQYKLDHPKCPTCGGTHTRRITTTSRAISVTATGLASRKLGKSFECLDCKYTW